MKRLTLLLSLLLVTFISQAQQSSENVWHWGEIDLVTGETVTGKLKYNLADENVLILVNDVVRSYHVNKVEAFAIKDASSSKSRYFFSIRHTLNHDYSRQHFFELLAEGQVSLLTRQELVKKVRYNNGVNPQFAGRHSYAVLEETENYFLMDSKGKIQACDNTNKAVLHFFKDENKKLREFMKINKLDVSIRQDMVYVVEYYNKLKAE